MKSRATIFLAALTLVLNSCAKPTPDPKPNAPSITGTWRQESLRIVIPPASGSAAYDQTTQLSPGDAELVLTTDGKATRSTRNGFLLSGTYTYGATTLVLSLVGSGEQRCAVKELSGNRLQYEVNTTVGSTPAVETFTYAR